MRDYTKHLSFLFTVSPDYMPTVKVITQYTINVLYTLDYRGVVAIEGYTVKSGMAQYIADWTRLEDEMLKAAENNSKQYRKPGQHGGGRVKEGDAYNDIHDQWKSEVLSREYDERNYR